MLTEPGEIDAKSVLDEHVRNLKKNPIKPYRYSTEAKFIIFRMREHIKLAFLW